ncbi:MAG: cytidylate kinase-like family protein [Lachnospiraceae bacterium]|nr:cytidylate kinase-like family protein [Lachnospiraceae bacterium]MDO5549658.1 cytidylate kinase-like family protein [Lachnospiraceae bacterium]
MTKIITVSREFGSGGRQIGHLLAERLGIPFYDKELIKMAAEDIDIEEHIFEMYDNAFMEKEEITYTPFSHTYEVPMSDQIFMAQSRVIRRLAQHGPCVIVGRCADMVLKDEQCLNLFFYASFKKRVQRLLELQKLPETESKQMEKRVREIDRKRRDYYQYYTGNEWGKPQNYHLCLDSQKAGMEACLDAAIAYMAHLN